MENQIIDYLTQKIDKLSKEVKQEKEVDRVEYMKAKIEAYEEIRSFMAINFY